VTQFAQSVSRNMDRLSLDNKFSERQKLKRQNTPEALSQGLRQGFDGLALSFLGAVFTSNVLVSVYLYYEVIQRFLFKGSFESNKIS